MVIEKAKPSREEVLEMGRLQTEQEIAEWKQFYDETIVKDMFDEDGYPTDDALFLVEKWHWSEEKGWFDFIKSIWHMVSYSWNEGYEPNEWKNGELSYRYYISTIGWSGNEAIIRAMEKNDMLWFFTWVQSRRGGHYIFELRS
jgi:hypothetical protein